MPTQTKEIIIPPLTVENYYDDPRISQSKLKAFIACPNYYKWKYVDKKDEPISDAFLFGKAVDCLITTPADFDGKFEVVARRGDGNFVDGKYLLTETIHAKAQATAAKLLRQPVMQELFLPLEKQVPLYDHKRKALLDFFGVNEKKKTGIIADLKTCANVDRMKYDVEDYKYRFQLAFYRLLAKQTYPWVKKWRIFIVAIDKTPKQKIGVFEFDQSKFRYEEALIKAATDGVRIGVRMSQGICLKCPDEVNCQYALFTQKYIDYL